MEDKLPNNTPDPSVPSDMVRIENLYGSFPRVTAIPTWTPTKFQNSIALDTTTGAIYYYDYANAAWRTAGGSGVTSIVAGTGITVSGPTGAVTVNATAQAPGGSDKQVQYNNAGAFGGTGLIVFDTVNGYVKFFPVHDGFRLYNAAATKYVQLSTDNITNNHDYLLQDADGTLGFVTQRAIGELHVACNSGVTTITCGFTAKIIRMHWSYLSSGTGVLPSMGGHGMWLTGGTYAEAGNRNSAASGGAPVNEAWSDAAAIVSGQAASNQGAFTGAIGNVTGTTFDLTMTNATGGTPASVRIIWEAEG